MPPSMFASPNESPIRMTFNRPLKCVSCKQFFLYLLQTLLYYNIIVVMIRTVKTQYYCCCYIPTFLCVSKYACSFLLNTCMSFSPLNPLIVDTPSSSSDMFKKLDTTDTLSVSKFSCIRISSTTSPIPAERTITGIRWLRSLSKASAHSSLEIQHTQ